MVPTFLPSGSQDRGGALPVKALGWGWRTNGLLSLLFSSLASGAVVFAGSPELHEADLLQEDQRRAWRLQNQPNFLNACTAAPWNKA